ncbi:MAG: hypothetical protein OEV59_08005 [Deltaproteobacteria bacterium]|nr:hypothetical protein [Deltaproteobacteria bacterium]
MTKSGKSPFLLFIIAALLLAVTAGCGPKMKGQVKDDLTVTGQTEELKEEGLKYSGPEYTVAIITFENKTPSKVLGVGEAATDILRTIVKQAGLEPIVLTEAELGAQATLVDLEKRGAIKKGAKDTEAGFSSIDFRISGSVTAFSQVEEEFDVLIGKSKSDVARVQVDYALVDVSTGQSLVAESGAGEYKKKVTRILGVGGKTSYDTGLRDGALRDALSKAMTKMIEKLNSMPFQGKVLAVEDGDVVIRAGTKSRLKEGDVLGVYSTGKDLVDPDTGRVIGKMEKKIGEITITSHQSEKISHASVKSGLGFKPGDVVKAVK